MSEKINDRIDEFEALLLTEFEPVECPVKHRFVPGMYIREIFMKKGLTITSMIHRTIHPFFILKGKVLVFSENTGSHVLKAPYTGITYPSTRRILYIQEDCTWATVHLTDIRPETNSEEDIEKAVDLIAEQILEPHINYVLGGSLRNNKLTREMGGKKEVLNFNN